MQLADGVHTIFFELDWPRVIGGAQVEVNYLPGVNFSGRALYAPSAAGTIAHAAGSTPTAAEFNALVDAFNTQSARWTMGSAAETSNYKNVRYLSLTTIGGNPGASSINITHFRQIVSGPAQTGI